MLMLVAIAGCVVAYAVITWRFGSGKRFAAFREIGFIVAAIFAYFGVRGMTEGDLASALAHAKIIVGLERALGFFIEPVVQAAVAEFQWIVNAANWVYVWGHWPVIAFGALFLYWRVPATYRLYRNAFFISGAIGLLFFLSFPTAPPRLADLGFSDTLVLYSESYRVLQPPHLVNQFAAFPSLHFGWNLLLGLALIQVARRPWVRLFGVMLPVAMFISIVVTGNHFILDAIAGAVVALIGLALACVLQWYTRARAASRSSSPPSLPTTSLRT